MLELYKVKYNIELIFLLESGIVMLKQKAR